MIELFGAKSPVIVVMNEKHRFKKELEKALLERFSDIIIGVHHVNLATNDGLDNLSKFLQQQLKSLPHIGQEKMLNTWLDIRNELQYKTEDFISFDEYRNIARKHGITDKHQALNIAKILHTSCC